jgi:hypothetical protein
VGLVKTNFDVAMLTARISQVGDRSSRRILAVMREEADKMRDLAKQNAPVDDGDLVDAIEVVEERSGKHGRTEITLQIDPEAVDANGTERVADYGLKMELGLAPYGSGAFSLGPKSQEKAAGGAKVGGKFMERAKDARVGEMGKKVKATLPDKV